MILQLYNAFVRRITSSQILLAAFICLAGSMIVGRFWIGVGKAEPSQIQVSQVSPVETAMNRGQDQRTEPQERPSVSTPSDGIAQREAEALELQVLRARNASASRLMDETHEAIRSWEEAREEWTTIEQDVKNGEVGRVLATDTEDLPRIVEMLDLGRARTGDYSAFRTEAESISKELDRYVGAHPNGEVTDTTRELIKNLRDEVKAKTGELASAVHFMRRRIADSTGREAGVLSIEEAIGALKDAEDKRLVDSKIAAREKIRKENVGRILEEEQKKEQAEQNKKAMELAAETARLEAEVKAGEIAAAVAKAENEARQREAQLKADFARDYPEIKNLLSPFVTPAKYSLDPPHLGQWTGQNTGGSFRVIVAWGALEPTDEGLERMAELGKPAYRHLGTFPVYVKSEWKRNNDVKVRLERAQELLRKYGELLVERGMLEH